VYLRVADDDPSKPLQSNQLTHLQERLLKKLGPDAYPFYFEVAYYLHSASKYVSWTWIKAARLSYAKSHSIMF